jgi:putative endonuclease
MVHRPEPPGPTTRPSRDQLTDMSGSPHNNNLGSYGERVAAQRLVAQGMVLVDRNWRCDLGEIDLVLRDAEVLVFCEVKTRSSAAYGHPLEAVTPAKGARLRRLAARWLEEHDVHPHDIRIDLVGVLLAPRGAPEIEHVRGVG